MGLLSVKGSIRLEQFWPRGKSDADTATIIVDVSNEPFQFQEHKGGPFRDTRAFEGTLVFGRQGPKPPVDEKNRIRVRLQGIDAPELHYRPSPLTKSTKDNASEDQLEQFKQLNKEYRQHFAESSTYALLLMLREAKQDPLPCEVTTFVSEPTDVFDTYGRFVGDIHVKPLGKESINSWLLKEGWVVPAFYDSMTKTEISLLTNAWAKGLTKKTVGKALVTQVGSLDFGLRYRSGKNLSVQLLQDQGPVLFPKLYRRLVTWSVYGKAGLNHASFQGFIQAGKDEYRKTNDYLQHGLASKKHGLESIFGPNDSFTLKPESVVFVEDANSQLKKDGQVVRRWW